MTVDRRVKKACKNTKIKHLDLSSCTEVDPGDPVGDVIALMSECCYGCVLVVEGKNLVGVFSERDLLMKVAGDDDNYSKPVREFMKSDPVAISVEDTMGRAIEVMNSQRCRRIPVVDEKKKYVGVIHAKHIIDCMSEYFQEEIYHLPPKYNSVFDSVEGA